MMAASKDDKIFIEKLKVNVHCPNESYKILGFHKTVRQFFFSLYFSVDVKKAAENDDIKTSIDYDKVSKEVLKNIDSLNNGLAEIIDQAMINVKKCPILLNVEEIYPKGGKSCRIGLKRSYAAKEDIYFTECLELLGVIGVYDHERYVKQLIRIDLEFNLPTSELLFAHILCQVVHLVEKSSFYTVEALAESIARIVLETASYVKVKITKPEALTEAEGAGVEITRSNIQNTRTYQDKILPITPKDDDVNMVFIGIGSNIECRIEHITNALEKIKKLPNTKITASSFLYESLPMYFTDQDKFYNGVIQVTTQLSPLDLFTKLQEIESQMGRIKFVLNGPRNIDLDIIFYGGTVLNTENLIIPHKCVSEREFVLRPLADICPNFVNPRNGKCIITELEAILQQNPTTLRKILPLQKTDLKLGSRTFVMGILNTSADSFSEPGVGTIDEAIKKGMEMERDEADIIDIGAVSRRPGSTESMSTLDEINCLVSVIQGLKEAGLKSLISVDVSKSEVAEAAINAGANLINYVGMGVAEQNKPMFSLVGKTGTPICIMHTRGSPLEMQKYSKYSNVTGEVESELSDVVQQASASGVMRWNIILDPGIGFAKTGEQNMEILQKISKLRRSKLLAGYPWLIGCSRKKFIGTFTGVMNPTERGPGSMAATSASIIAGADIVRVHDVKENVQVCRFMDSFHRLK